MDAKKVTKRGKHRRRYYVLAGLAIIAMLAGTCLTLLVYRPGRYNPSRPANPNVVSPYLTHKLGPDFYNQVQLDQPFELEVDQAGLNDVFSRVPWPMYVDGISFAMPTVFFTDGQVSAMAEIEFKGVSAVVTIMAMPAMNEANKLNLNIQSVMLGALPITPLAKTIAEKIAAEYLPANPEKTDPSQTIVNAALSNQPFDPILTIEDYTVRLKKLTIESGKARLLLVPVKE